MSVEPAPPSTIDMALPSDKDRSFGSCVVLPTVTNGDANRLFITVDELTIEELIDCDVTVIELLAEMKLDVIEEANDANDAVNDCES